MSTSNPSLGAIGKMIEASRLKVYAINIRAFRAIDDRESCERFYRGHQEVLSAFGFKLSSSNQAWMEDPDTFVIIVESLDRTQTYGGARIQRFSRDFPLPILEAIGHEAPEIYSFVENESRKNFAEICGLWNSVSVAGLGIGSVYSIRCAISVAGVIGVEEMIALCSVHTFRMANRYGFKLLESVGQKGLIPYAGAHQIARLTFQPDVQNLSGSLVEECNIIRDLRINPNQIVQDIGAPSNMEIHYKLNV